eukprot:PhM_4_TR320/c0_g1_i1/m.22093
MEQLTRPQRDLLNQYLSLGQGFHTRHHGTSKVYTPQPRKSTVHRAHSPDKAHRSHTSLAQIDSRMDTAVARKARHLQDTVRRLSEQDKRRDSVAMKQQSMMNSPPPKVSTRTSPTSSVTFSPIHTTSDGGHTRAVHLNRVMMEREHEARVVDVFKKATMTVTEDLANNRMFEADRKRRQNEAHMAKVRERAHAIEEENQSLMHKESIKKSREASERYENALTRTRSNLTRHAVDYEEKINRVLAKKAECNKMRHEASDRDTERWRSRLGEIEDRSLLASEQATQNALRAQQELRSRIEDLDNSEERFRKHVMERYNHKLRLVEENTHQQNEQIKRNSRRAQRVLDKKMSNLECAQARDAERRRLEWEASTAKREQAQSRHAQHIRSVVHAAKKLQRETE